MIQLDFMKKNKIERDAIVDKFCKELYLSCQKTKRQYLDDWCTNNLCLPTFFDTSKKDFHPFLEIMKADFSILIEIKEHLNLVSPTMQAQMKDYLTTTVYEKINHKAFTSILGVSVCPYCNRNYINSTHSSTTCQFDHFFCKDDFPIFSASFYNLIPVCPSCNLKKSVHKFSYSPYDISVTPDQMYSFSYLPTHSDYLTNRQHIKILINESPFSKIHDNLNILKLQELYQLHSDIVQELIIKKQIYSPTYNSYLKKELNISENELNRLITSAYTNNEDYGKRPLSKLITDISKEIGLI